MRTDYQGLSPTIVEAFEAANPVRADPAVVAELAALETLFGRPMPPEVSRVLESERHPNLSPRPAELAATDQPFEALILRAQELGDCVSVLFPLTGSIYLKKLGDMELVARVPGALGAPVRPFVGWRRDAWATDLATLQQLTLAHRSADQAEVERRMLPIWRRVQQTEYTEQFFGALERTGASQRLEVATADQPEHRGRLEQWWAHERALFCGFAMLGKFRPPHPEAFAHDPKGALDAPTLLTDLGLQMALLWRGWFLAEDGLLEASLEATQDSRSMLVQDARRLLAELKRGRRMVGSVDFAAACERYPAWVADPEAYRVHLRAQRRAALEERLRPSEHGIELVRAQWPLEATPQAGPEAGTPRYAWDREAMTLLVHGHDADASDVLPPPDRSQGLSLARQPKSALSPSGRYFFTTGSVNQPKAHGPGRENAPVLAEYDRELRSWRAFVHSPSTTWVASIAEHRLVVRRGREVALLRDLGHEVAVEHAYSSEPEVLHVPELGLVISYGSADIVMSRDPDDTTTPALRLFAYWDEGLDCVARFPVDAVELALERREGELQIGVISADRALGWELRGLREGLQAWREASRAEHARARAQREAFGEVTIERAVEALNAFLGTDYGTTFQEGIDAAFDSTLRVLREDPAAVAAARDAPHAIAFAEWVREPFASHLRGADRGPAFAMFAAKCVSMRADHADIVVRAATTSAWRALGGSEET